MLSAILVATLLSVQPVHLNLEDWSASIDPGSLTVRATLAGDSHEILLAAGDAHTAADVTQNGWRIPDLGVKVSVATRANRLHIRIDSTRDFTMNWPRTGDDPLLSALVLPDGEGLYLPLTDRAWLRRLTAHPCFPAQSRLSMPFWSYALEQHTVTFLALSDIRTEVCMEERNGRIAATTRHAFLQRDGGAPYEIEIWPGGASPISPALEYRAGLIASGQYVPLTEKIRRNPEASRLLGAIHMYVSGDGRTLPFLDDLRALGVEKAWIGYDQDRRTHRFLVDRAYTDAAKNAGYLIGPYDTFENAQNPKTADSDDSIWGDKLYTAGCIVNAHKQIAHGFAGRGCELSSEALKRAEHNLNEHVEERLRDGANSYFLDTDAFGELFDDYSTAHPMTQAEDRANRLQRMKGLRDRGLVLGSEEGVAWSAAVIDFAHGAFSTQNQALWQRMKQLGRWWPPERPGIFFQPVALDDEFAAAKYDPVYRIPLYEAAFHASVVATDRWDVPLVKIPALTATRELLELLYGVPSMWAMDRKQLRESRDLLIKLVPFFENIHRQIGSEALTEFEWLTPNHKVQRTTFGTKLSLTANFDGQAFGGLGPGCIQATWLNTNRRDFFCGVAPAP